MSRVPAAWAALAALAILPCHELYAGAILLAQAQADSTRLTLSLAPLCPDAQPAWGGVYQGLALTYGDASSLPGQCVGGSASAASPTLLLSAYSDALVPAVSADFSLGSQDLTVWLGATGEARGGVDNDGDGTYRAQAQTDIPLSAALGALGSGIGTGWAQKLADPQSGAEWAWTLCNSTAWQGVTASVSSWVAAAPGIQGGLAEPGASPDVAGPTFEITLKCNWSSVYNV